VVEHPRLAAAQHAQGERDGREQAEHAEGDLDADEPALGPVDVVELEQQGDSSRVSATPTPNGRASHGSSDSSRATTLTPPATKARTIPGTKWWMWRPPSRMFPKGPKRPPRRRMTSVDARAAPNVSENEPSRLSRAFSRVDPPR
jgi:hypothetical protein